MQSTPAKTTPSSKQHLVCKTVLAAAVCVLGSLAPLHASAAEPPPTRLLAGDHSAVIGTRTMHYSIAGTGPLLVVQAPGWGIGAAYLANGLAPLRQHVTLLVYDPRGTGGSSPVTGTGTITNADMAEDLEHLRAYLGLSSMDLLGHSNGSAIAILYAERYPQRVRKLVLVGSQLLGYHASPDAVSVAEKARRKSDPQFAYYLAHIDDPAPDTDAAFTAYFNRRVGYYFYDPSRDVPKFLPEMTQPMGAAIYHVYLEQPPASQAPPMDDLHRITASTLIVEGQQDPACPLNESEAIHAGIRNSQLVVVNHSGHFPWIEQPAEFFPAVTRFLAPLGTAP